MSNEREEGRRLLEYFESLRGAPKDRRDAFLQSLREENPALATELETLLATADSIGDDTMPKMASQTYVRAFPPGFAIGDYAIQRPIAQGGMGSVYEAVRTDGRTDQRVAVKILHSFMHFDSEFVRRFLQERRTLSRLLHPNIATLIDAQELEDGRPYMIMELVDGVPITEYLDSASRAKDRVAIALKLSRQLCDSLAYAHQRLIVHRDIKPSNVLVTSDGRVKLIDFGISKALEDSAPELTQEEDLLGTLPYAAPEHVDGTDVNVSSDIYSVGMLLFEMLAGHGPYAWHQLSRAKKLDAILNQDAPNCSAVAQKYSKAQIEPDLDAVVSKCLEKDPSDRYESMASLRADIENVLSDRPVLARPSGRWYRVKKFLERNQHASSLVGASAAAALAALALFLGQVKERRLQETIAQQEREKGYQVAEFLVDSLQAADPSSTFGENLTLRRFLFDTLASLNGSLEDQPVVKASLYVTIGEVLASLSDFETLDNLIAQRDPFIQNTLQDDHGYRARWAMVVAKALSYDDKNAEALARLLEIAPLGLNEDLAAKLEISVVTQLSRLERLDEARERADRLLETLNADRVDQVELFVEASFARATVAHYAGHADVKTDVVLRAKERADGILQQRHPLNMKLRVALARSDVPADKLITYAQEAVDLAMDIYGPKSLALVSGLNALGGAYKSNGDLAGALSTYQRVEQLVIDINGENHGSVARIRFNIATTLAALERLDDSYVAFEGAIAVGKNVWPSEHFNLHLFQIVYGIYLNQGGKFARAEPYLADAHRIALDPSFHVYESYIEGELAYAIARFAGTKSASHTQEAQHWLNTGANNSDIMRDRLEAQIDVARSIGMPLFLPEKEDALILE